MMYGKPPMGYGQPPMQYKPGPMPPQPPGQYQPGSMQGYQMGQFGMPQNALAMGQMQRPQGYNALAFGRMR
jgi:hypothetical protein